MNELVQFRKIIERIQEKSGLLQNQIAEQVFDITPNNLNNKIRRNSVDIKPIAKWAMNHRVNLHWLLTGEGDQSGEDTEGEALSKDVDLEVMTGVIKGVEKYLQDQKKTLDPDKKARLISLLYDHFTKTGEAVNQKTVVSYLRLVA
jgi:hypothetical protein